MHVSFRRRALLAAAAAVPAALAIPAPAVASAAPAPPTEPEDPGPGRFCSTTMLTPEEMDAGVTSTIICHDTYEASLRAVGVDPAVVPASQSGDEIVGGNASSYVAIHYRDNNGSGEALMIEGAACNGGGLSFAAGEYWNDKIRSTTNRACSTVKHWSEENYAGEVATSFGTGNSNLGSLAGRVSSIKYFGPAN